MKQNSKKKLILATGIFPPDVGGPSTYVFALAEELVRRGWVVVVVTYGDVASNNQYKVIKISRKQNIVFRYLKYFLAVLKHSKEAKAVLAFDLTSSGLPAFFGAILRRKKTIVRMGGDFLWEKAFSKNWTNLPLEKYYKKKKSFKEKFYFALNRIFIKRFSRIIFTNDWMRRIYFENYKIKKEKSCIIKNPYPHFAEASRGGPQDSLTQDSSTQDSLNQDSLTEGRKSFIFAGRLIKLKNLDRFIKAISSIPEVEFDVYGEGPEEENISSLICELDLGDRVKLRNKLSHVEFMKKLRDSYVAIIPSVTEVSPNTVLECIKLGVPVLSTKECGLFDDYKNDLIFIDPMNSEDIRKKIRLVLKKDVYEAYRDGIKGIDVSRGFGDVAKEIEKML